MNKIFIAVAFLLLGVVGGSTVGKYSARRHQHATSAMWLAQFHLDRLADAVHTNNCTAATQEVQALGLFTEEISLAFPLATTQDATFRDYFQRLRAAVRPVTASTEQCAIDSKKAEQIRAACDACHKDYR